MIYMNDQQPHIAFGRRMQEAEIAAATAKGYKGGFSYMEGFVG